MRLNENEKVLEISKVDLRFPLFGGAPGAELSHSARIASVLAIAAGYTITIEGRALTYENGFGRILEVISRR